jgi:hypothetical protein
MKRNGQKHPGRENNQEEDGFFAVHLSCCCFRVIRVIRGKVVFVDCRGRRSRNSET